ncbi:MaoC like domain-containing protein [Actinacidiphila glaucinigra]|uniref:MaoC like domain-containing protein n=1 Tax=Actinacidiphila glaucinigra TaxID=235986 RepID=A0A239HWZ5_9ACTN|nr:MaoC like domain-containing protein [Actinacidiphila glaucinigra]
MTGPGVRTGDVLPELRIPVTRTLVVAGAIATRDFQDVHHDPDAARAKGSPDVFLNILTTGGLVGRYLAGHFGPSAVLRSLRVRLGAPAHPGDELVFTGNVTAVRGTEATVEVLGTLRQGRHVTGTAVVEVGGG